MGTIDIIYDSATQSINGVPAIPENKFKSLAKNINESFESELYWKQRCQYAEILLDPTYSEKTKSEIFKKWHNLRYKTK